MELNYQRVRINKVMSDTQTFVQHGCLHVNLEQLRSELMRDPNIRDVQINLANPGESCRILPVKDAIEPRCKVGEKPEYFCSLGMNPQSAGSGVTRILDGAAVLVSGPRFSNMEGIVDMFGPGQPYTPFGNTCNVVLWIEAQDNLPPDVVRKTQHNAGARAAEYLACLADAAPDQTETLSWDPVFSNNLPRVAILDIFVFRAGYDTLVYGRDTGYFIPTVINPLAALDGAIENVSGRISGHRPATYHHQNNPTILEAIKRHNSEINLVGVLIGLQENSYERKIQNSQMMKELMRILHLDGLIIIEENKGNPDVDLMLSCKAAEDLGIKTVLMTDESAGEDGASPGMADFVPEATAIISSGNCNEAILLPPAERIIGDIGCVGLLNGSFHDSLLADGSLRVELLALPGSCVELGTTDMTCIEI